MYIAVLSGTFHVLWTPMKSALFPPCTHISLENSPELQIASGQLRAMTPILITMPLSLSTSTHWTAQLESDDQSVLVPVYRLHHQQRSGWLIAPRAGTYKLVIRTPQADSSVDFDDEPPACFLYRTMNDYIADQLNILSVREDLLRACGIFPGQSWAYDNATATYPPRGGLPAKRSLHYASSVLLHQTMKFTTGPGTLDKQQLLTMAKDLHGEASRLFPLNGTESFGYWIKKESELSAGSHGPLPNVQDCPGIATILDKSPVSAPAPVQECLC